jgi:outer membrane receptor protein involved in Fe transport
MSSLHEVFLAVWKPCCVGIWLAVAMALPSDLRAQTTTATLRGKAADQQGAALPGVAVTARQVDTNTSLGVISSHAGQYFLPNLPPGRYEVSAELQGFRIERRTDLVLQLGQELTIDFTLKVGGLQETVTVGASAPILETAKSTVGTIITKDDIDDLPTVERDFSSLARLAPNVTPGVGGNGDSLSMNGQRGFSNGFFIDGATAEWQYYGKQSSTMVQDWIQEFQVMTNSFSAEFGTASGGILNVITRSGSNRYHARAYGFFRDAKLDSAPFAGSFTNGKPDYLHEAAPFSQQRIGGFVGGPIVRDRLFFFAGAETLKKNSSDILGISDYWRAQGLETVLPAGTEDHPYLVKIDLNANNKNRLSVRYDRSVRKDLNLSQSGSAADTKEDRYAFGGPIWNLLGNYTTTLSNNSFNEARLFYGSNKASLVCNKSGTGGTAQLTKAPVGSFAHIEYPGALFGCPTFTGLEGEENIVLADNLLMSIGRHQLKIGAQGNQVRTIIDVTNYHDGFWSHPTDRLFNRTDPTTYPDAFIGNVGPALAKTNLWNSYYYIQDTWQANGGLTLNLGLRYDVDRSATAGNDLVDAKNARIIQRYGGAPLLQKTKVDYNNVAPRVGVVWTPARAGRTTIRGSGGIFYDQNHNNFNAIYIVNTLLSDGFTQFDANNALANPFYNPVDPAGSAIALRAFLAGNYPFFPDLSLAPTVPEVVDRLDPNLKVSFTAQYSGGLSHNFGRGLTVDVDYVHADGKDMPVFVDENITFENGVYSPTDRRFARILTLKNVGASRYDALLTQAQYRWSNGHSGVSYTLSKATSNNEGGIFGGTATNPFDLTEDQGPDSADRRHNLVLNGSYVFPFNVQVAGIAVYRSAAPYSVSTRFQLDADPFRDRPEPRNSRRGDSESTVDVRISKVVRIGALRITGFWEMFNTLNTDNFVNYAGSLQSSGFGQPLAALDKRRQQFGFRIDF